jgi:hypothetical protein
MTETMNADKLRITEGFVVWVVGRTVEETALLDPLPEGVEVVEERNDDQPDNTDAAILFVDSRTELVDQLDEVLPQLGSIPIVWICYPSSGHFDLGEHTIIELVDDYGWQSVETAALDETWSAVRIQQA